MRIQILATPEFAEFAQDFCSAWSQNRPTDTLHLDVADLRSTQSAQPVKSRNASPALTTPANPALNSGGTALVKGLTIASPRQVQLDAQADLYLVIQSEITDVPDPTDLANLVVARAARRGLQPVVVLAADSPLSRRQLQESGIAQAYFLTEHPARSAARWGRILGQTWRLPD